ncbi:MAG: hypothetical protein AB7R89_01585 [Dehalococcoidia bacterium]
MPVASSTVKPALPAMALLSRATGAAQTLETSTSQPQTYQHLRIAQERLRQW